MKALIHKKKLFFSRSQVPYYPEVCSVGASVFGKWYRENKEKEEKEE